MQNLNQQVKILHNLNSPYLSSFLIIVTAYSTPTLRSTNDRCPFCENYEKLYFDAKHLQKGLNKGWGVG